ARRSRESPAASRRAPAANASIPRRARRRYALPRRGTASRFAAARGSLDPFFDPPRDIEREFQRRSGFKARHLRLRPAVCAFQEVRQLPAKRLAFLDLHRFAHDLLAREFADNRAARTCKELLQQRALVFMPLGE